MLDRYNKGPDEPLGPALLRVMKNISSDCEPLFRQLPDDGDTDEGRGVGASSLPVSGAAGVPTKWVMLRYPWQAPTPEEAIIPFHGRAPSKVMTDWVKGMFRRTFGKDTLAKTLLQNGCSNQVLVEYKHYCICIAMVSSTKPCMHGKLCAVSLIHSFEISVRFSLFFLRALTLADSGLLGLLPGLVGSKYFIWT